MQTVNQLKIGFKKLHPDAVLPEYAHFGDSGFDLRICEDITIPPHETILAKTGLAVALPPNYELQVRARSGLSLKTPLLIKNGIGTVDSNYRGEIGIICHNLGDQPLTFKKHDRLAQGVIVPVVYAYIHEIYDLPDSNRQDSGYGSSGIK